MIHFAIGQAGLIVADQSDAILAGDIFRRHDYEFGPVELRIEGNFLDCAARNLAANGRAVKHSWQGHVIDVLRGTVYFVAAFLARYRLADCVVRCHAMISCPLGSPQNFPALNTGRPRRYVASTTPCNRSPMYGDMG